MERRVEQTMNVICGVCLGSGFELKVSNPIGKRGINLSYDRGNRVALPLTRRWENDVSGGAYYGVYPYVFGGGSQELEERFKCVECKTSYEYSNFRFTGGWSNWEGGNKESGSTLVYSFSKGNVIITPAFYPWNSYYYSNSRGKDNRLEWEKRTKEVKLFLKRMKKQFSGLKNNE